MEDDPIEDGAGVAMNAATAVARVAETLLRAAQQRRIAQEELRARLTEDARRQYEAEAVVAEEYFKRATQPEWMDQASPRETSEAWLGAQRWQQVDGARFSGYAQTLSEHYQTRYGLDLVDVAERLESPELAAELAEARVARTREAGRAREGQDPTGKDLGRAGQLKAHEAAKIAKEHAPSWYQRYRTHTVETSHEAFSEEYSNPKGLIADMTHLREHGTIPAASLHEEWAMYKGKYFASDDAERETKLREFWEATAKERQEVDDADRARRNGHTATARERAGEREEHQAEIDKAAARAIEPIALEHADAETRQAKENAERARNTAQNSDRDEAEHTSEAKQAGGRRDQARRDYDDAARRSAEADRLVTAGVSPKVAEARKVAGHLNGADPKGAAGTGVRAGKGKASTRSRRGQQQQRTQGRSR